jgi:hypothetical protein
MRFPDAKQEENMHRLFALLAVLSLAAPTAARADADALRLAIEHGDRAAVLHEIAAGADVNRPFRPLMIPPVAQAALRGNGDIVRVLLDAGADPDAVGFEGMTALAMSVRSCSVSPGIVRALLEAGADPDARSGSGATALMMAVQAGRDDIAELLIAHGADMAALNLHGDGVLNYAIYYQRPAIVRRAVHGGAPISQLDVLFTTRYYYQVDFGMHGFDTRKAICRG